MTIVYSGEGVKDTSGNLLVGVQNGAVSGAVVTGGRRNLIINGAMQVAQRGTSFSGIATGTYYLDRWRIGLNLDNGSVNLEQSSDAPDGFGSSLKLTTATAETTIDGVNQVNISQRFEGQDIQSWAKGSASAKSVTVSFWVKSSLTGTFTAELYDDDNNRHIAGTYTINSANTWEYKTITFAGDTSGAIVSDNGRSIDLRFWTQTSSYYSGGTLATSWASFANANAAESSGMPALLTTTNATWQITGVQLEVGSVATPFEHRSYGEELALCQRYFVRKFNAAGGNSLRIGTGGWGTSTSGRISVHLATDMRARPTITAPEVAYALQENIAWRAITTISSADSDNNYIDIVFNVSSSTASQGDVAFIGNGGGGSLDYQFDAEL
jgi:hypothetical protein